MPKIKKEKFRLDGTNYETQYPGTIELTLHYDANGDFFFFPTDELKSVLGISGPYGYFSECKTRKAAIAKVRVLLGEVTVLERYLKIRAVVGSNYEAVLPSADTIKHIFEKHYQHSHAIGISFERIVKVKVGDVEGYWSCDNKWELIPKGFSVKYPSLIEWTEAREQFLINMQGNLDLLCKKVVDFFNTPTLNELLDKMEVSNLLESPK